MSTIYNFFGNAVAVSASPNNWITTPPAAGGESDGTAKNDFIVDVFGSPARLVGGQGDDSYYVQDPGTQVVERAGGGVDTVVAYVNYVLPKNVEVLSIQNNWTTGVSNSDGGVLQAYSLRDVLIAGSGNDELVNVGGQQTIFVEGTGSGHDVIYGFRPSGVSNDLLALPGSTLSYSQLIAGAVQQGSDVLLQPSAGTELLIKNTTVSSLTAADFMLDHSMAGEKMTFGDDFNGLSLWTGAGSSGVWKTNLESGSQTGINSVDSRTLNDEQEIYVDASYKGDPNHSNAALGINPFSVNNGILTITAAKTPSADLSALFGKTYTSGMLTTAKSFAQTYGYFEMRAELPSNQGVWPAFWLLPKAVVWPPEIDIMENVGKGFSTGGAISADGKGQFYNFFPQGLTGYHTYGLEWTPTTLTWYVDGHPFGSMATPSDMHQPMYMLVNLAVGGSWPGNASFDSASEHIDYVHAYALASGETDTYGADGGVTKHFAGITGQAYTSYDAAYNASGVLTSKHFYDASGTTIEADAYNADGSWTAEAGLVDRTYSASGVLLTQVVHNAGGAVVETDTFAFDGSYTAHLQGITGQPYVAADAVHAAGGALISETFYLADGSVWTPPVTVDVPPAAEAPAPAPTTSPAAPDPVATPVAADPTPDPSPTTPAPVADPAPTSPVASPDAPSGGADGGGATAPTPAPTVASTPAIPTSTATPSSGSSSPPAESTAPDASTIHGADTPAAPTVLGTAAGDSLAGTKASDWISAGAGDDTIAASAGNDVIDGGDGSDTVVFSGFAGDYVISLVNGAGTVSGGPEGGTTTLTGVENVKFLDGTLTFDLNSEAAQIVRLYDAFLGRAPDVAGLNSYLQFVSQGHTLADMAANAAASPEFQSHTANLTDAQFVDYVYETALHRHADPGGLATYVADLADGTFTRTSMILQAAESPEHIAMTGAAVQAGIWQPNQTVEALELLYDASVQRAPDPTGLSGYGAMIASGTSLRTIANQMANSAEFLAHHAGQTDAEFVDSLYVAEVGRHADPTGLASYTDQLAHGYTRGDILWETALGQEHQDHVLSTFDPLLVGL